MRYESSLLGTYGQRIAIVLRRPQMKATFSSKCHHHSWMWDYLISNLQFSQPGSKEEQKLSEKQSWSPITPPIGPPNFLLGGIIKACCLRESETKFSVTFNQKYFNLYKYHLVWKEPNCSSTPRWLSKLITCSKLHYFNQYYQKIHVNTNEGRLKSKSSDSDPLLLGTRMTSPGPQLSTWH